MYNPRVMKGQSSWLDETGVKIYTVSTTNTPVVQSKYSQRLIKVKSEREIDWLNTPSFVIFHDGASCDYLVLVWWHNVVV